LEAYGKLDAAYDWGASRINRYRPSGQDRGRTATTDTPDAPGRTETAAGTEVKKAMGKGKKVAREAEQRWLSKAEVASRLGISKQTADNWIHTGRLPRGAYFSSQVLRWPLETIEAFEKAAIAGSRSSVATVKGKRGAAVGLDGFPWKAQRLAKDQTIPPVDCYYGTDSTGIRGFFRWRL
jgi:predicted DNA-binding transcriptional regulator AlpA